MSSALPWYILLLPLISAAVIVLLTRRWREISAIISVGAAIVGFIGSCVIFASPGISAAQVIWIDIKPLLYVPLGFVLDDLSKTMLVLVTGVGALIHIYSLGYMRDDAGKSRYFAALSLFMFSMLGIVLADNFVMMFIFWELVGVSSYLLIGHWFERDRAAAAANKAFLTNRIGDFGFMLGILMVWSATGSVVFQEIAGQMGKITTHPGFLAVAALLVFCGAVGKSAQFPLHVWLPDAMEGPTPISALIHAATMVAAGVYMLVRVSFLIQASPQALTVVAWIGTITAVMAGLIATQQNDIKRILAYSTLSQLGYMIMAVGLASGEAAMFHLFTHAFFKALLFLGAGSIIIMLHHEQNIWQMGGLAGKLRITFVTFLIGTLALIGCPPFSGFFSKDAILALAYEKNMPIFAIALFTAFLTAFYMLRLVLVVFFGNPRSEQARTGRESPLVMTGPLMVLAIPAALAGFGFIANKFLPTPHTAEAGHLVPILATAAMVSGVVLAFLLYRNRESDPLDLSLLRRGFYVNEFYGWLIGVTQELLATISAFLDRWIIDGGGVRGISGATWGLGSLLRLFQVGNLQAYSFLFGLGIVGLIYFTVFPMILLFIVFCPLLAALAVLAGAPARRTSLAAAGLTLAATLVAFAGFERGHEGFSLVTSLPISAEWGWNFALGIDGLSLIMILLTAIVTLAAVWFTGKIAQHENAFYACLLLIAAGAMGAFASLDLFFFYAFHALALIPTFLLIGIWGSGNRFAAAWKITIYLATGSFILLLGLILLYRSVPEAARSFDLRALKAAATAGQIPSDAQRHIYLLLLIGFGILVSLFPFHTWAPEAYASAPAPAAMLHAGVLKKFGLYGLLRIAVPMLPEGSRHWALLLIILLLGNIIYVGLVTLAQKRLDWMLGYSSVMHMGYIFLGIASANLLSINGAAILIFAHGISIALLFAIAGEVRARTGTLLLSDLGGLAKVMPMGAFAFGVGAFASIGLPGFANFAAEVMVVFGAFGIGADLNRFHIFQITTALALWGVVISAVYMLRAYRATFLGPLTDRWAAMPDLQPQLRWPIGILVAATIWIGFFPQTFVEILTPAFRDYFSATK